MNPSINVISIITPPTNTIPATSGLDMVSFVSQSIYLNYSFGSGSSDIRNIKIRNDTTNGTVKITMPQSQFCSYSQTSITLNPGDIETIIVSVNASGILSTSIPSTLLLQESVNFSIEPLNVTGPVYVYTNLPSLTL